MGANAFFKLLLLLLPSLAAAATTISPGSPSGCIPGRSYWETRTQRCERCSRCGLGEIVARPCDLDRDVICGPIADLDLDYWAWLKERRIGHQNGAEGLVLRDEMQDVEEGVAIPLRVQDSLQSTTHWEWDWHAEVLLVAIAVCVFFFAVAAGYSLHHARHWRILEEHYEADVEEISSRLALMTAANDASLANCQSIMIPSVNGTVMMPPPSADGGQDIHCANLEQLLAGKSTSRYPGRSNVYIEDNTA